MAITAIFDPGTGLLTVTGDAVTNSITASRDAAGKILVNGGAVPISGGTPTVANTALIQVFGLDESDVITLNEANGALPAANLFGGMGNDTITAGSGSDQLTGATGNDVLLGKGGADFLFGGADNDILTGGDGDDQMFGEDGDDRMIWNPGDDSDLMEGGDGADIAEVNAGNGAEVLAITANGLRVRFDRLDPAPFALDIGTTESLVINANGGNDLISATGNLAALISLTIDGGTGNDTILGSNGNDVLGGGEQGDLMYGDAGDDLLNGGMGLDTIDGGFGNDTVNGGVGNDTIFGNSGFDRISGGDGNDTINGGDQGDVIAGDAGNDFIGGGMGLDTIDGGAGNDTITGGMGDDQLTGSEDADTFAFGLPGSANDGVDTITDFVSGTDVIQILATGYGGGLVAGNAVTLVMADAAENANSGGAGYFILDNSGVDSGTLYWDVNGGNGEDAVAIAVLTGVTSLQASDFHVV